MIPSIVAWVDALEPASPKAIGKPKSLSVSSASIAASEISSVSRASLAKRQMMSLHLGAAGVDIQPLNDITIFLAKATECERYEHEEASWNAEVHLRLLYTIFENPLNKDLTSPTLSINHTDFEPIQLRPLLLSIKTRSPGIEWDNAQLQIGVWHAAQWVFLRWAVNEKLLRQCLAQNHDTLITVNEEEEIQAKTLAILSKTPFIPGIIIQGIYWKLVIVIYADGKT
ncbi:hypothetical protein V8C37DRAFT_415016 [Trichoderma ceciliae]